MARQRQIIETVTCDVCGETTDQATSVTLGWGREQWELDLCPTHNAELSSQFESWTANARRVAGRTRSSSAKSSRDGGDSNAIREWARASGYKVGDKGRISAEVREAYVAANG